MRQSLTRQALYDLIWETPMKRLGPELGLTASQLSLICNQYEIDKPGYGYWTLRDMGRPVVKPPLGPPTRGADDLVSLDPPATTQRPVVRRPVREKPKAIPRPPKPSSTNAPRQVSKSSTTPPAEPLPQTPIHPLVERTQSKLAAATAKSDGMATVGGKGLFKVMASAVLAERVGQFLSQIVRGVEGKGWTFENGDGGLKLIADGEPIAFELVEQTDRVPHVQTEKETAALLKFEEQRARALRTRTYFSEWDKPKIPDWDHRPSGRLTLKFEAGYHHHRLRRSFSDGKRQRLETMIDAILEAFVAFADGEKAWRVEQERRRLQAIEDEKRRRERERIETLETKRREFLKHQLVWHEDAKAIEDFVASFGPDAHQDPAVGAFLAWAKGYAGRLRNQISVATLRGKLEKYDLMNDAATISSWTTVT